MGRWYSLSSLGSSPSIDAKNELSELPDCFLDNPWQGIKNYYEEKYPNVGGFTFSYAGLMISSISSPKILINGDKERATFSILLLGNSGSGKSSLMSECEDLSPRSHYISSDTAANSERTLAKKGKNGVTLVVNDLDRILNDSDQIKAYEAMIGDGRISKRDAGHRDDANEKDLRISMIGGAVPADVTKKVGSGLLFRVVPLMLKYEKTKDANGNVVDEEAEVAEKIVSGMGQDISTEFDKEDIRRYYYILDKIARGHAEDIPQPVGYVFSDKHKKIILDKWNYLRNDKGWSKDEHQWFRELQDGLRFACLKAFLNLNNRPRVNIEGEEDKCKIKVQKEDAELAAKLMMWEMAYKWKYVKTHLESDLAELSELDADNLD